MVAARVAVNDMVVGAIDQGLLILLGVGRDDTEADGQWLAEKITALRIFEDAEGKMNRSVVDIGGGLLVVSQFTLFASTRKGTRPSFNVAGGVELAIPLYEAFQRQATALLGRPVACGQFGAKMAVTLVNDGPVTIMIDSKTRE